MYERSLKIVPSLFALTAVFGACGGQALDTGGSSGTGGANAGMVASSGGSGGTVGSGATGSGGTGGSVAVEPASTWPASGGVGGAIDDYVQPAWPDNATCSTTPSPLEGTWTGYVQGQGHERDFTLVFAGGGDTPCGTFMLGEPADYPPASDPQVDYLHGQELPKYLEPAPGFAYTLLEVDASLPRLSFRVSFAEPYIGWCGLQQSFPGEGEYDCAPRSPDASWSGVLPYKPGGICLAYDRNDVPHEFGCDQWALCTEAVQTPCFCQKDGCQADLEASGPNFDLHFDGNQASGVWDDSKVFLQKQ